jgi:hypothetical protein
MGVLRCVAVALISLGCCAPAYAQAPDAGAVVALKGGWMRENAEDGLRQTSAALGISAAFRLSPRWMLEAEVADNGLASPKHRESLVSVSGIRSFRERGVRPYLAVGLTFGRNEETRTACFADRVPFGGGAPQRALVGCDEPDVQLRVPETSRGGGSYLALGGGAMIPLWRRVSVVPDVRVHLAATAAILRPTLGLALAF